MKAFSKKYRASPLLNKFGLLQAFGSLFSVTGNYFSFEYNNENLFDDAKSLQSDWRAIGQDMQSAAKSYHFTNSHASANRKLNAR